MSLAETRSSHRKTQYRALSYRVHGTLFSHHLKYAAIQYIKQSNEGYIVAAASKKGGTRTASPSGLSPVSGSFALLADHSC